MNPIEILNSRYLPKLQAYADQLRQRHPTFVVNTGCVPVGSATPFQGYQAYLSCLRLECADEEPNCVDIVILVRDLPGRSKLCSLDVSWGGDGIAPVNGIDLLTEEIEFTPAALTVIDEAIPRLQEHLDYCLLQWEAKYPKGI